jgi:hypothetical protein
MVENDEISRHGANRAEPTLSAALSSVNAVSHPR